MAHAKRSGEAGFTLVELLICLALFALLLGVFAPAISESRAKARLAASAREMALALRTTRDRALIRGDRETFAFDALGCTYRTGDTAAHEIARDVDVQLVAPNADARGGVILFYADGGSTGGRLRLTIEKRRLDVDVDWLTGRVSVAGPGA